MFRYKWQKSLVYYKKYLKRKNRENTTKKIVWIYKDYRLRVFKKTANLHNIYTSVFLIRQRKRQNHFTFCNVNTGVGHSLSTGQIIAQYGNYGKFFKRNPGNLPGIALQLKKTKQSYLQQIYLLSITNYNKKQNVFLEKLFSLSSFKVLFFVHKKSYIGQPRKKHRIARTVLRLLLKQAF